MKLKKLFVGAAVATLGVTALASCSKKVETRKKGLIKNIMYLRNYIVAYQKRK